MSLKYRFIKMMKKHGPLKKADLTRRALSQFRINMGELDDLIAENVEDELIASKKFPTEGAGGRVPTVYFLTGDGKKWLRDKNKEIKKRKL
jgi:DNA-binding PadR family transcriptional regulator